VPITTLIDLEAGTQPAHYFAGPRRATLLLANTGGFGLLAKAGDLHGRNGRQGLPHAGAGRPLLPPVVVARGAHAGGLPGDARRPAAGVSRSTS
jgi:topoisomerase IV subunit A